MPQPEVLRLAARTGEGIPEWIAWLSARRAVAPRPPAGHAHPYHQPS
jgi:hypothetical protein